MHNIIELFCDLSLLLVAVIVAYESRLTLSWTTNCAAINKLSRCTRFKTDPLTY